MLTRKSFFSKFVKWCGSVFPLKSSYLLCRSASVACSRWLLPLVFGNHAPDPGRFLTLPDNVGTGKKD